MGEFADMLVDQMWDRDSLEQDDQEDEGPFCVTKTCRYCGEGGMVWGMTTKGWRLHDDKGIHVCEAFGAKRKEP